MKKNKQLTNLSKKNRKLKISIKSITQYSPTHLSKIVIWLTIFI